VAATGNWLIWTSCNSVNFSVEALSRRMFLPLLLLLRVSLHWKKSLQCRYRARVNSARQQQEETTGILTYVATAKVKTATPKRRLAKRRQNYGKI